MVTIWVVDRIAETLSLCDVPAELLPRFQRVRVKSDGEWLDAYEWIG